MSYGLFNWWWGEDTEESEWSWLIAHLNKIVEDVKPERKTKISHYIVMQHHTENKRIQHRVVGFPIPTFSYDRSYFDVDTVEGVTNLANWMEQNIRLPLDVEGNYDTIANDTITAFVKALKTHRPFYEENIKGGEPFVWIPMLNSNSQKAQELWWREDFVENMTDDFWRKIDRLFMDIGQGYICINPEANRIITHF